MIHGVNVGGFLTLDDVDLAGRTVLLRVDANSPMDPDSRAFLDDTRLREALPTLQRLSGSAVVVMAHQSRPGKKDFTSTSGHAREFQRLLGRPVRFIDDIHGDRALEAIGALRPGQVLMLDNVRMDPQEMTSGDLGFEAMASTAFVDDSPPSWTSWSTMPSDAPTETARRSLGSPMSFHASQVS